MPNRILREGIIDSEKINSLSPGAELFYRRLMSKVDDYGRFQAHPQLILAACYPLQIDRISPTNVREWLAECAQAAVITLYEIDSKKYLEINNFGQRTRTDSKFPAPCAHNARIMSAECAHLAAHARARSESESESNAETDSDSNSDSETGAVKLANSNAKQETRELIDEQWSDFRAVARDRDVLPGGTTDWEHAWHAWKVLDPKQKERACMDIRARPQDSPELEKSLPQNYIRGRKWERPMHRQQSVNGISRAEEAKRRYLAK